MECDVDGDDDGCPELPGQLSHFELSSIDGFPPSSTTKGPPSHSDYTVGLLVDGDVDSARYCNTLVIVCPPPVSLSTPAAPSVECASGCRRLPGPNMDVN